MHEHNLRFESSPAQCKSKYLLLFSCQLRIDIDINISSQSKFVMESFSLLDGQSSVVACILCGDGSSAFTPRTSNLAKWRSDCIRSFCTLLALPVAPFQPLLNESSYCENCAITIWDINSTIGELKILEQRLKCMNAAIEDKVSVYSNRLEARKVDENCEIKPHAAQLIANGNKVHIVSCTCLFL